MDTSYFLLWLIAGLIPYYIEQRWQRGRTHVTEVRALFWNMRIYQYRSGRKNWKITIPLSQRLGKVVWAAIDKLREND